MRPRTFATEPAFRAWLAVIDWKSAIDSFRNGKRDWNMVVGLERSAGVKIPHNAARHTFISYHRAKYNNPSLTAGVCGTSEGMQAQNYMNPAFRAEAEEFFAITPESVSG